MTDRPALLVFAKAPRPGRVKTRLCPPLAPEEAAALSDAFLRDALDRYAAWAAGAEGGPAVRLYLAGGADGPADRPSPPPEQEGLGVVDRASAAPASSAALERPWTLGRDPAPPGVEALRQRGAGLGERMLHAFVETFAAGHDRAVVVGTDHPTLPTEYLALALDALKDPLTAVLGPSDDGGYYLLGLNEVVPDLFDMAYSHGAVFEDTLGRAMEADLTPVVLPEHYDVDDGPALDRLAGEWRAGADVGPRTADMLQTLTDRGRLGT